MSPTTPSLHYFSHYNQINALNTHNSTLPENQSAAEHDAYIMHLATMAERSRVARELHDSVTQSLYSLTLMAEGWRRMANEGKDLDMVEVLTELGNLGKQALKEARLLVHELRPPILEEEGLIGALKQRLSMVEKRAGVDAQLLADREIDLLPEQEEELYWMAQEALSNSLKHSGAEKIRIRLTTTQERYSTEPDRLSPKTIPAERVSPGRVFAALAQPALPLPALAHFGDITLPDASTRKMLGNQYDAPEDDQKYSSAGHRWPDKQMTKQMGDRTVEYDSPMLHAKKRMESSGYSYDKPSIGAVDQSPIARHLILEIEDNGSGFDTQIFNAQNAKNLEVDWGGMGLRGMQERAAKLNGTLTIKSTQGKGTCIQVVVPLT